MKILLAGRLSRRLRNLSKGLTDSRHHFRTAFSSAQVWQTVVRERVDAIVLDATTTDVEFDPWRLCTELRQATQALLIVLIRNGRSRDRIRAFRAGASQCLTMPVSPRELAACLDNIPRPRRAVSPGRGAEGPPRYADGKLQIDVFQRLVRRDGSVRLLAPRETVLLTYLLANIGRIVHKEELCEAVWPGAARSVAEVRLKIHAGNLRRKIERDPKKPSYIVSQRGRGYGFIPQRDPVALPGQSGPNDLSTGAEQGSMASELVAAGPRAPRAQRGRTC